jgi:hypothetical protein
MVQLFRSCVLRSESSMATHVPSPGPGISRQIPSEDDLHDLTSEIHPRAPVSCPQMHCPFPEHNLSVPTMNYQYSMTEGHIDLTYLLAAANMALHQNMLMQSPQAGPSGLHNGRASDMLSTSVSPAQPDPPPLHHSLMQSATLSPKTTSFPVAMTARSPTVLSPRVPPDSNDRTPRFGAEVLSYRPHKEFFFGSHKQLSVFRNQFRRMCRSICRCFHSRKTR